MFSLGSIAVGLEVIEEGAPLDSDSDVGHYVGNDVSDTRKCILQIQQLNRRVRELERNVDTHSVGFWSKIAFFAFTIINPILLQWLFWRRRWTQSSVQLSWKKNSLKVEALVWQMLFALVRLWTQTVTDLWRFNKIFIELGIFCIRHTVCMHQVLFLFHLKKRETQFYCCMQTVAEMTVCS